jgi:hypothetical protein
MKKIVLFVAIIATSICIQAQGVFSGQSKITGISNYTGKLTVPEGKTWQIIGVFSDYAVDVNGYGTTASTTSETIIFIKSLNGIEITNLTTNKFGPVIFCSMDNTKCIHLPLILPSGSTIEFLICKGSFETKFQPCSSQTFINYIEITNP